MRNGLGLMALPSRGNKALRDLLLSHRQCMMKSHSPLPQEGGVAPKGETTHYDLRVAIAPSNHVRCARRRRRRNSVRSSYKFSDLYIRTYPQGSAQLHSGRANTGKALLNSRCPLRGHRVYEVKNDNVAPFLLYAGPTLPDLAILCRITT